MEKAGKVPRPLPKIKLEVPTLAPWPYAVKKIGMSGYEEEYMSEEQILEHYAPRHSRSPASSSAGSQTLSPRSRHKHYSVTPNAENTQATFRKSGKNPSMSRILGLDDPAPGESPGSILAKLAIAGGKQNGSNDFSMKMLVAWVNRGFSVRSKFGARPEKGGISDHNFGADIVTAHALSILEHLPAEWKNRRLGQDLLAAPNEDPFVGLTTKKQKERRQQIRDEAATFKLKLRKEISAVKKPEVAHHGTIGRPRKVESTTTTVRPGRVSGKAAVLRIPGTSLNPQVSADDDSSSDAREAVAGPARKRRRASPPEMGEDDDELATFGNEYNLPIRETELFVKSEPLPEVADLSPAEMQQLEDEKQLKLNVVHKEAALNNRNLTYLEEFLATRKGGPIQRSPLF